MQTITKEAKKKVVKLHIPNGCTIASPTAAHAVSNWIRVYSEEFSTNDAAD